ncbi:MAG: cytochrome-c peroxidase [Betaproteobacteria bacterium]|nr:cytochrome-c peroxidase [Betaproteobacteria bacterium]
MIKKDYLHFLLYTLLTLLATVFAVKVFLPRNETGSSPSDKDSVLNADIQGDIRRRNYPILPIPSLSSENIQSGKVLLGERLFHDPMLSGDGTVSCATCHDLSRSGADGRKTAVGVGYALGSFNTPTVFNTVFNFRQFWNGRVTTLADQVSDPLTNIAEMASSWVIVIRRVSEDKEYRKAFDSEYDGEISEKTIADAIACFETTLLTPNSLFDRFLDGDTTAISDEAKEGYRLFTDYGCISCHQGINIGGNFFQRFGVMGDYFTDRGNLTKADLGRYNITGREEDLYVFKVPGLRNVAVTAPYFHDGSVETLDKAIEIMSRYQLGRELSKEDRRYIAAFLESLTGEYRGERLKP